MSGELFISVWTTVLVFWGIFTGRESLTRYAGEHEKYFTDDSKRKMYHQRMRELQKKTIFNLTKQKLFYIMVRVLTFALFVMLMYKLHSLSELSFIDRYWEFFEFTLFSVMFGLGLYVAGADPFYIQNKEKRRIYYKNNKFNRMVYNLWIVIFFISMMYLSIP